jgi:hypothetical protein
MRHGGSASSVVPVLIRRVILVVIGVVSSMVGIPLDRIVQVGQRMAEGDTFQHLCDLVF